MGQRKRPGVKPGGKTRHSNHNHPKLIVQRTPFVINNVAADWNVQIRKVKEVASLSIISFPLSLLVVRKYLVVLQRKSKSEKKGGTAPLTLENPSSGQSPRQHSFVEQEAVRGPPALSYNWSLSGVHNNPPPRTAWGGPLLIIRKPPKS